MSEHDVNSLAAHQFDERQLLVSKFESELATLHETQLREFKQWVMCVHEEYKTSNQVRTFEIYQSIFPLLKVSVLSFPIAV